MLARFFVKEMIPNGNLGKLLLLLPMVVNQACLLILQMSLLLLSMVFVLLFRCRSFMNALPVVVDLLAAPPAPGARRLSHDLQPVRPRRRLPLLACRHPVSSRAATVATPGEWQVSTWRARSFFAHAKSLAYWVRICQDWAMRKSRGQVALAGHARDFATVSALARRLGYSRQRVVHWIEGTCRPDAVAQQCLQSELGIQMTWWREPAKSRARRVS